MSVERRSLTKDVFRSTMFVYSIVESRLMMSQRLPSTTEEENAPLDPTGRRGLPRKVSRLRTKLSQKAKQEPKFRFYSLYDRIYRLDVLQAAWRQVRKPNTAPGVDGVTFCDIEESENGVEGFLEQLQEDLRSKRYKPDAVRRVHIPKPDGRTRPLEPFRCCQGRRAVIVLSRWRHC